MKAKPSEIPKCYILPTTRENSPFELLCFCCALFSQCPLRHPPFCSLFPCLCYWLTPCGPQLPGLGSRSKKKSKSSESSGPSPAATAAWAAFDDDGISFGSCVRHRLMAAIHQITRWRWRTSSRKFGRTSWPRESRFAAGLSVTFLFSPVSVSALEI